MSEKCVYCDRPVGQYNEFLCDKHYIEGRLDHLKGQLTAIREQMDELNTRLLAVTSCIEGAEEFLEKELEKNEVQAG